MDRGGGNFVNGNTALQTFINGGICEGSDQAADQANGVICDFADFGANAETWLTFEYFFNG